MSYYGKKQKSEGLSIEELISNLKPKFLDSIDDEVDETDEGELSEICDYVE